MANDDLDDLNYFNHSDWYATSIGSWALPSSCSVNSTYTYAPYTFTYDNGITIDYEEAKKIVSDHFHLMSLIEKFPTVEYHYQTLQAMIKLHTSDDIEEE